LEVRRKLLIRVRWSITSFMGTLRTEVAVGTDSDASMFLAVRIGAPRIVVSFGWAPVGSGRRLGLGAFADRPAPDPGSVGVSLPDLAGSAFVGVGLASAFWAAGRSAFSAGFAAWDLAGAALAAAGLPLAGLAAVWALAGGEAAGLACFVAGCSG